jgi:hypothetical protein
VSFLFGLAGGTASSIVIKVHQGGRMTFTRYFCFNVDSIGFISSTSASLCLIIDPKSNVKMVSKRLLEMFYTTTPPSQLK